MNFLDNTANDHGRPPTGDAAEGIELQPWLIVLGEGDATELAMWQIAGRDQASLAMFIDRAEAERYASSNLDRQHTLLQLDPHGLLRVMADCFRQGVEFAALNPDRTTAKRLFVLRDVLKAAKVQLRGQS